MKLILVCEASADAELAGCLIRRSLRAHGPDWLDGLPEVAEFEGWTGAERKGVVFWTDLAKVYRKGFGRSLQGRNIGPYSLPALQAILLAEREVGLDALVLMVDLDREKDRRTSLLDIRRNAEAFPFDVLVATPDPEREAWVLHGFEPADPQEEERLAALKRSLGFDPRTKPHKLRSDARRKATHRDIKQVLAHLVGERDRERHCWEETSLEILEVRGEETYLRDFLVEIREILVPRLTGVRT